MNGFAMAAFAPQIEKFSALSNSRRIFKPRVQTIFEAADKITPALKAAMDTSDMRAMLALMPVNPLAGRLQ
jgi:hypothetical protein